MKHAIAPERFAPAPRSESRNRSQPFVAARAPCARQLKLRRVPAVGRSLPAGRKAGLIVVRFAHGALEAKACLRLLPRNRNSWFPHATAPLRGAALATCQPPSTIDLPWRARSRILGGAVAVSHQLDLISSRLARRIRPANPTRSGRQRSSGHPINPSIITRMRRTAPGCFCEGSEEPTYRPAGAAWSSDNPPKSNPADPALIRGFAVRRPRDRVAGKQGAPRFRADSRSGALETHIRLGSCEIRRPFNLSQPPSGNCQGVHKFVMNGFYLK